jgi:hypothetical protein
MSDTVSIAPRDLSLPTQNCLCGNHFVSGDNLTIPKLTTAPSTQAPSCEICQSERGNKSVTSASFTQLSPKFHVLFTDFSQHVDGAVQFCAIDISVSQLTLHFPKASLQCGAQPKGGAPNMPLCCTDRQAGAVSVTSFVVRRCGHTPAGRVRACDLAGEPRRPPQWRDAAPCVSATHRRSRA